MTLEATVFLVLLFFAHWVGDFVLQDDDTAKKKSTSNSVLLTHVIRYSLPLLAWKVFVIACAHPNTLFWWFYPVNVAAHFAVDYYTSRWTARLSAQGETQRHNFFVVIGLDQWLHTATLLVSFHLLFKL